MATGGVIVFDGECAFCIGSARFILKRDSRRLFRFAASQSEPGRKLLLDNGFPATNIGTIVLVRNDGRVTTKTTAALDIAAALDGPWPIFAVFRIVPRAIRDFFYTQFAKRRRQWFPPKDACFVPSPEERGRFLEASDISAA